MRYPLSVCGLCLYNNEMCQLWRSYSCFKYWIYFDTLNLNYEGVSKTYWVSDIGVSNGSRIISFNMFNGSNFNKS